MLNFTRKIQLNLVVAFTLVFVSLMLTKPALATYKDTCDGVNVKCKTGSCNGGDELQANGLWIKNSEKCGSKIRYKEGKEGKEGSVKR